MDDAPSRLVLALLMMALPFWGACRPCTTAECGHTLRINLDREGGWESGTWDVVLEESETRVGSCTIELPQSPSASDTSACTGDLDLLVSSDGPGVDFVQSFYDFTDGRELTLSIRRNGEQVSQTTLNPNFEREYANGPICDDTACRQATVQYAF